MSENENLENNTSVTENQNGKPEGNEENSGGIKTLDEALAELKRVRQEAASRRIANRELEEKAKKWQEYEDSQKTELQKLQEELERYRQAASQYEFEKQKREVLKEFELEEDDFDLLTGSDLETVRKQAEKIKAKNEKIKNSTSTSRPADLLAGNRGTPVGGTNDRNLVDDIIRRMAKGR